jgi:hypothetical protein
MRIRIRTKCSVWEYWFAEPHLSSKKSSIVFDVKMSKSKHQQYSSKDLCCGSGSAFASNENPDPHQSDKLDPEPDLDTHQFADDKPK